MDPTNHPIRLPDLLTDGVIVLDGHTLADAEAHWAGEDEEMRLRFDATERASLEQMRAAMARWMTARAASGPMIAYALRAPSGELAGGCEIRLLSADRANVSYWVYPRFRKAGHAARALMLLSDAAASIPGLGQLEAHIDPDNLASRRVAEKAGYAEAGMVEDEAWTGAMSTRLLYVRRIVRDQAG